MVDVYDTDGAVIIGNSLLNVVTPEMFGAVGDGVADDTAAIQNALNEKGLILFSSGKTYKVTAVLRVYKDTIIDLNGSTINCTGKHLFFNFLGNSTFTGFNGNGNITIRNGKLIGGAISFAHGENILLENLEYVNSLNDHFLEVCACKNYRIKNCRFVGMAYLTTSVMEYINIDPCYRGEFPWLDNASSVFYDGAVNDGLSIDGCVFDLGEDTYNNGYNAIGVHSSNGNKHNDIRITNNKISGFTGCGLRINNMQKVVISQNDIRTSGDGIRVGDVSACSDVVIIDNYVKSENGSKLALTSGRYSNLTVSGNVTEGYTQDF